MLRSMQFEVQVPPPKSALENFFFAFVVLFAIVTVNAYIDDGLTIEDVMLQLRFRIAYVLSTLADRVS